MKTFMHMFHLFVLGWAGTFLALSQYKLGCMLTGTAAEGPPLVALGLAIFGAQTMIGTALAGLIGEVR